jgi:hypothetical protein
MLGAVYVILIVGFREPDVGSSKASCGINTGLVT